MTTPPAAVAQLPTIGEVVRTPRVLLWVIGVYLSCASIAVPAAVAYCLYYTYAFVPWRLLPMVLWGVYMSLVMAEIAYMDLFLPRAPMAAQRALIDVGCIWVAVPLSWMVSAALLVPTWMFVFVVCLFLVVIAAVVALWVWLVRTYTGQYTEVGNGGSDWFLALFLDCIKPYAEEPKPESSTVLD